MEIFLLPYTPALRGHTNSQWSEGREKQKPLSKHKRKQYSFLGLIDPYHLNVPLW